MQVRTLLLLIFMLLCIASPGAGATFTVGPGDADFSSIQDAVDVASDGDTITVLSGTYQGGVVIDKRLVLNGMDTGAGQPILIVPDGSAGVTLMGSEISITGFAISGSGSDGISVVSDRNTVQGNTIEGTETGISCSKAKENEIVGNRVSRTSRAAIVLLNSDDNMISQNTLIDTPIGVLMDARSSGNTIESNEYIDADRTIAKLAQAEMAAPAGNDKGNRPFQTPTETDSATPTPTSTTTPETIQTTAPPTTLAGAGPGNLSSNAADQGGVIGIAVLSVYILLLGASALILGILFFRTAGPSEDYVSTYSRQMEWILGLGHGIIAAVLVAASLLLLPALIAAPVIGRMENLLEAGMLDLPLVYLAISSAILATSAVRARPVVLIHQVHPAVALVAALLFWALFGISSSAAGALPGGSALSAVLVLSAIIAVWHYRGIRRKTTHSDGTDRPGDTMAGVSVSPGAQTILPEPHQTVLTYPAGFPPELQARYDRIEYIGKGGLGQVFRAVRRDNGNVVAVKIPLSFDEVTGKSFMKEMRFWEDLVHPNIVEVYSVNILPIPYVEMEYVPRSLEQIEKPMTPETAARIAAGIAAGLAYAHSRGVIHRDVKPHNVLITDDGIPKITDWGMGTAVAANRETSVFGFSLSYAAPEQIAPKQFGRTDARTDIYQLGVVFYEMITGRVPFASESIAEYSTAILTEEPVPPSQIHPDLGAFDPIILRCLAKDPAERYQSAADVKDAIETLIQSLHQTTPGSTKVEYRTE
jgi:parallel beta-helix repeat protein